MNPVLADISPLQLMAWPFAECLVLVGIHSYLGLHVIRRQVIFVDLSLAQIAALGTTIAFWAGIQPHSFGAFLFSLSFTIIGAAIFAVTRSREERVPQEAIIGLVYALAAALVVLVIDRAPHGAEHIKDTLTGTILYVRPWEVAQAALAYTAVGIFHFVFRRKFISITEDAQRAAASGINVPFWDFLFYVSFGFVITFSVETAGVLLVFIFLVVPAVIAISLTTSWPKQLLVGWGLGTVVSVSGLALSYKYDMPSGPTVVAFYGLVLLTVALVLHVVRASNRKRALLHLALGTAAVIAGVAYFIGLKKVLDAFPKYKTSELLAVTHRAHREADHAASRHARQEARQTPVQRFDSLDIEAQEQAVQKMKDPGVLQTWYRQASSPDARLSIAKRLVQLDPHAGAALLLDIARSKAPPFHRMQALGRLAELCKEPSLAVDVLEAPASDVARAVERAATCIRSLPSVGNGKSRPARVSPRPTSEPSPQPGRGHTPSSHP